MDGNLLTKTSLLLPGIMSVLTMSNNRIERVTLATLQIGADRSPHQYYKYYLREKMPQSLYVAEGMVVVVSEEGQPYLATSRFQDRNALTTADEYYQAILSAQLPERVRHNEAKHNMALDDQGQVADLEFTLAALKSELFDIPIVASVLYRREHGTQLLVQLLSCLPLRPSLGLETLKARFASA